MASCGIAVLDSSGYGTQGWHATKGCFAKKLSVEHMDTILKRRGDLSHSAFLGKGSFGTVIRVKHLTDSHEYAVKMMWRTSEKEAKYQKRELDILTSQVKSPCTNKNIVKYYDSWMDESSDFPILCIRMELCGENLENLLREHNRLVDDEHYKYVFPQILRGLEFIHGEEWVHRDINPLNILIAKQDGPLDLSSLVIKLADFGLARQLDQLPSLEDSDGPSDEELSVVGTLLYRAPEMSSKIYDCKVDMYSAGLVLYRLCRYFKSGEEISPELEAIKRDGPQHMDTSKMSHRNDFLLQMIRDLLTKNPNGRPSASKALERFDEEISSSTTVAARAANDSANSSSEEDGAPDLC